MPHDVVVIQRRERVVLAAVVAESRAGDGSAMLTLVAEDGARFQFPAAQALVRVSRVPAPEPDEDTPKWLMRVRGAATANVDWRALHGHVGEGGRATLGDMAVLALADRELDTDLAEVAVALASGDAAPWFRRDGAQWIAVPRAEAEARLARVAAESLARAEDEALRDWWPRRSEMPPPESCRGALDAIAAFALRGAVEETERGRTLAARLDLPEPDHALEALVLCGVLPHDTNPAPHRAGLAGGFSRAVLDDAERIAAAPVDRTGREDLTHLVAVAVDDAETTEVDDAFSVRETADGFEILVHISDVAALVAPSGPVDRAVARRATSLYLPETSIAMLPQALVERLSLSAGVVREAVTGVFAVAADGRVTLRRFTRSLIEVSRRLTYEATADVASLTGDGASGARLVAAAEALRAARREAGASLVSLPSLKVTVTDGAVHVATRHQTTPGDLVVAELMVLYNREAARVLAKADAPAFFRTQGPPRDAFPAESDPLFELKVRRRFAASAVSVEPARHHGVGADAYLQATSPMRRFADLVNQRQFTASLAGAALPYRHADLERVLPGVVARERVVRLAADDRTNHWIARAFEGRIGATVAGVLSRAPRRGLGSVWVPSLSRELPLRPTQGWTAPAEGTAAAWRIARVQPWRGRIELEPDDSSIPPAQSLGCRPV